MAIMFATYSLNLPVSIQIDSKMLKQLQIGPSTYTDRIGAKQNGRNKRSQIS